MSPFLTTMRARAWLMSSHRLPRRVLFGQLLHASAKEEMPLSNVAMVKLSLRHASIYSLRLQPDPLPLSAVSQAYSWSLDA